jgi:hypothetical protein
MGRFFFWRISGREIQKKRRPLPFIRLLFTFWRLYELEPISDELFIQNGVNSIEQLSWEPNRPKFGKERVFSPDVACDSDCSSLVYAQLEKSDKHLKKAPFFFREISVAR